MNQNAGARLSSRIRSEKKVNPGSSRQHSAAVQTKGRLGGTRCKARSAMQGSRRAPQTRSTATALALARSGKHNLWHTKFTRSVGRAH